MSHLSIAAANSRIVRLPALKPVVLQVLASFERPELDIDSIVNELARDQTLSARVLRLANSSFYGLQTRIATLHDAVMVLGFRHIRATVAAVAVTECFTDKHLPSFDFPAFWRHAAAVGLAARTIAAILGRPGEVAFLAGLLHDIGVLVLLSSFPEHSECVFDHAERDHCLIIDAEHDVIGIDHAMIGEALAERWKFPAPIRLAIGAHHLPDAQPADSLANIVHLADVMVHAMGISDPVDELVPPLSDIAFNRLGLDMEDLRRVMREVETRIGPLCQALHG